MSTLSYQVPTSGGGGTSNVNVVQTVPIPAGTDNIGTVGTFVGLPASTQYAQLVQGAVSTANPSYAATTGNALSLTTTGQLRVALYSAAGTAVGVATGGSILTAGTYSSAAPVVTNGSNATAQLDSAGSMYCNGELRQRTYSATGSVTVAATATDVFTLYGNGTNTLRVRQILISGLATTAGGMMVQLIKRSAANTGGTSAALTTVPHNSANTAAVSTAFGYTVNPTGLGGAVGAMRNIPLPFPLIANAVPAQVLSFGDSAGQAIVLSGTAQGLAVNLQGAAVPAGATLQVTFVWTEE